MIKKISKLKNFGIFQEFSWKDIEEFKAKNLIYGWNYSGKTTLSKLFHVLEDKGASKYFNGSEFALEIEYEDVIKTITEQNVSDFPFQVRVFNTEYIKRVFTWDDPKSDIDPISFYLGDPAGNIKSEIDKLEKNNKRLTNIRDRRYQKKIDDFLSYNKNNGKFTEKAKEIREEYLPRTFQQSELNKSHFERLVNLVKNNTSQFILPETEKSKYRQEVLGEREFDPINVDLQFHEKLADLTHDVKKILEDTAPKSIPISDLDENSDLFDWVQTGLLLHKESYSCKFCTNILPASRVDDLNSYYSTKLKEIQTAIDSALENIKKEKISVNIDLPDESKLAKPYRTDYQKGILAFKEVLKEYTNQLKSLESDLTRKRSHIFENITSTTIKLVSFSSAFDLIRESIGQHNTWLTEFDDRKIAAKDKMLKHYAAEYVQLEDYLEKENKFNCSESTVKTINAAIASNEENIFKLNAKLSNKVKGQEELNKSLKILLHRDDLKIEIRNDKFTLERNSHFATSLSEGEKSAIAFSYFLTELKSLREEEKLNETIIFIDDPISSLDSNHIFQVRSLIQGFFAKGDFCQLFVSTHNFEFFSVLLDTKMFSGTENSRKPLYFIQRVGENNSTIKNLPKTFSSYKSEYVGLFHIIKEFNELDNKEDFSNILILPNAVRRFLELYTLMKYPTSKEVDARVRAVFSPEDKPFYNTKLLHWFSHQNQYEKVHTHDDKLLQIEGAIDDLLKYIKDNDELHWKGLNG